MMPQFTVPGSEFVVTYDSCEDGGGTWFGQEYVDMVRSKYQRRFRHCLEWCSGPGFIGFALLAHGLVDRITFMDRYHGSATSILETCTVNNCSDFVEFHNAAQIADLPEVISFDLVVGNPPHYLQCPGDANYQRLAVDQNWNSHREFYANIRQRLTDDGVILIQENQAGSLGGPAEFSDMIRQGGLMISAYWTSPNYFDIRGPTQIYYLESKSA
jgi:methylase of polypeptide subunit release factors